ncbi:hypothetical protein HaLaN_29781, partial [Haematococcus lacustris]
MGLGGGKVHLVTRGDRHCRHPGSQEGLERWVVHDVEGEVAVYNQLHQVVGKASFVHFLGNGHLRELSTCCSGWSQHPRSLACTLQWLPRVMGRSWRCSMPACWPETARDCCARRGRLLMLLFRDDPPSPLGNSGEGSD